MNKSEQAVEEYLARLDRACTRSGLTPEQRAEVTSDIREHIAQVVSMGGDKSAAAVRQALDRLGDPEAIAAAAADPERVSSERDIGAVEVVALGGIAFGWLLFGFGGLIGSGALLWSKRWSAREKAATVLAPLGPLVAALLYVAGGGSAMSVGTSLGSGPHTVVTQQSGGSGVVGVAVGVIGIFCLLAPFLAAGFLAWRIQSRDDLWSPATS